MNKVIRSSLTACAVPGAVLCLALLCRPTQMDAAVHTEGHMVVTELRPMKPGDQARADAVLAAARKVAAQYTDYRKALADGYAIFMPGQKQQVYHFVLESANDDAKAMFDPNRPAALLYEKLPGETAGYKLVGVMYTASFGAPEEELEKRIPLSISQWHEHVNLCIPPDPERNNWLTADVKFGLSGSITTQTECTAAGGQFRSHLSGWMTHVYPFERSPAKIWPAGMDDDHTAMPGMKM